jgi:hypothetical protein
VHKSVDTKLRMIVIIMIINKLSEEECKCAQVRKNKAAHIKIFIGRGVQVCASL